MSLPIQIISTDFDGTLHSDLEVPPIPPDLQALIGNLQVQGARWVINTGRDLASVMDGIARARLEITPDYLVVVEREIYAHDGAQYVPLNDWNKTCHSAHEQLFGRMEEDLPRLVEWVGKRFDVSLFQDDYSPLWVIARDGQQADAVHAYFEEYCREVPNLSVVRNDVFIAFAHRDYNKGTSLGEIARRLRVAPDRIFAAGDHYNDLPMLSRRFAHCLAAPQNAIAAVKEQVRSGNGFVSEQPWGHGVARALEHYLSVESRP